MYKLLLVPLLFCTVLANAQFITGVQSSSVTATSATVTWSTCTPATTSLKYGPTTAYGTTTPQGPALVILHNVSLTGLLPSTTYHFSPMSSDSTGASVSGLDSSFTTPAAPTSATVTSFWPATQVPGTTATTDTQSVELGIRFTSDDAGQIVAIRFYKGAGNTGTHAGTVWSSTGAKLFSGTFVNETASGWQELAVTPPVTIAAGTTYTVSYHDPNGHYANDQPYFTAARSNPPLHSLVGAGVYVYGANPAFPTSVWNNSNYWVDVKVSTSTVPPPPCNPPSVFINGVCTPPAAPKPDLSWNASATASLTRSDKNKAPAPPTMAKSKRSDSKRKLGVVITYNLYRSATPGGPYALTNSQPITGLTYRDVSAAPATTYYYVVRAVNPANAPGSQESANSNELKVVVP